MKITIIGAGNMGGAIARACVAGTYFTHSDITCTARSSERLAGFAAHGFNATSDNRKAVEGADIVVFAVKPWLMEEVVRDVAPCLDLSRQIVASVAAGVTFSQLSEWIGGSVAMFRVIPNTAIEVGSGVTFISSSNASSAQRSILLDMFSQMGYALEVEEDMMAAGTALASCGIAYAMKYIQASATGGEALGFSSEQACRIVEYTVKGAAELLLATGNQPQTEIDKVTTPGGMTQKGLAAMEGAGLDAAVRQGLEACLK
jgi:pyrroline-5-carboxylate reductase